MKDHRKTCIRINSRGLFLVTVSSLSGENSHGKREKPDDVPVRQFRHSLCQVILVNCVQLAILAKGVAHRITYVMC